MISFPVLHCSEWAEAEFRSQWKQLRTNITGEDPVAATTPSTKKLSASEVSTIYSFCLADKFVHTYVFSLMDRFFFGLTTFS